MSVACCLARRVRGCGREWEVLRDFERSDNWYAKRPPPTTKQSASRKRERSRRRAPGIAPTIKLIISTLASASASLLPQAKTSHCAAMLHDGCDPSLHVGLRNANQQPFAVRALQRRTTNRLRTKIVRSTRRDDRGMMVPGCTGRGELMSPSFPAQPKPALASARRTHFAK